MKKLIFYLLLLSICFSIEAKEKHTGFAYHSFTVKDRNFEVVQEYKEDGHPLGVIIDANIDGTQMIGVTLGKETVYEVQIVNTVEDDGVNPNEKCVMYQGGMKFQGEIVVINVLYFYDVHKNKEIPEYVWIDVNNSPTIMELSGLVKINEN